MSHDARIRQANPRQSWHPPPPVVATAVSFEKHHSVSAVENWRCPVHSPGAVGRGQLPCCRACLVGRVIRECRASLALRINSFCQTAGTSRCNLTPDRPRHMEPSTEGRSDRLIDRLELLDLGGSPEWLWPWLLIRIADLCMVRGVAHEVSATQSTPVASRRRRSWRPVGSGQRIGEPGSFGKFTRFVIGEHTAHPQRCKCRVAGACRPVRPTILDSVRREARAAGTHHSAESLL